MAIPRILKLLSSEGECVGFFRRVRWPNGVVCPVCSSTSVIKWGRYRSYRRYLCKGCGRAFNDRAGTLLHYSRWSFRALLLFIMLVMLTHSSVNFVSWLFGKAYMSCFRLFKKVLINVANSKGRVKLRGRVEVDEVYQKAGLKGRNNSSLVRSMRPPRRRGLGRRGRVPTIKMSYPYSPWLRGEGGGYS